MTTFLPSTHGFRFSNSDWPHVPLQEIDLPLGGRIPIGDAGNGLCGGMAFAARDYARNGVPVPELAVAPGDGPLYEYVVGRLLDSFHVPRGILRYLDWMNRPDRDVGLPIPGLQRRGVRSLTVLEEVPQVLAEIDGRGACCLGLVVARGPDPRELGRNHQVLAYGYRRSGRHVAVRVYDPNDPLDDTVTLHVRTDRKGRELPVEYDGSGDLAVRGFFRVGYVAARPPAVTV
jgi:hypothetical protein